MKYLVLVEHLSLGEVENNEDEQNEVEGTYFHAMWVEVFLVDLDAVVIYLELADSAL